MNQDDVYMNQESEAFFQRNFQNFSPEGALLKNELRANKESILGLLENNIPLGGANVLEVGSAVGDLLYVLREKHGCSVTAMEPSKSAARVSHDVFNIQTHECTFARSPLYTLDATVKGCYDLIIFDDVVGWMSPELLLPSIGVIDHLLRPGGFLFFRELYSPTAYKVRNRHQADQEVFQHRYADGVVSFFLNTGMYATVAGSEYSSSDLQSVETTNWKQLWRDSLLQKLDSNIFPEISL